MQSSGTYDSGIAMRLALTVLLMLAVVYGLQMLGFSFVVAVGRAV